MSNDDNHRPITEQLFVPQGSLLFIDLETTGLEADCDILQIAGWCGEKSFMKYVIPTKSINPRAAQVNKIRMCDGLMYYDDEVVLASTRHEALNDFVRFIEELGPNILLAAHNGVNFDFPRLLRQLERIQVGLPVSVVGFLDTKLVLRDLHPGLKSYSLINLVSELLDSNYRAHDAMEDARVLQDLLKHSFSNHGRDSFHAVVEKHLVKRVDMETKTKKVAQSKSTLESKLAGLHLNP